MPLFLSRNRPQDRTIIDHRRRVVRRGVIASIRDVCEPCNGGPLSRLDTYAADLDQEYFIHVVSDPPSVKFRFNFHLLLRWLLKISYNDDRTREPPFQTEVFVPYILGKVAELPFRTNVLVGLIVPSRTTTAQREKGAPEVVEPLSCGLGYGRIEGAEESIVFHRFVEIYSYFFSVISWKPGVSRPVVRRLLRKILNENAFYELRPSDTQVQLDRPLIDALTYRTTRVFNAFPTAASGFRDKRRR